MAAMDDLFLWATTSKTLPHSILVTGVSNEMATAKAYTRHHQCCHVSPFLGALTTMPQRKTVTKAIRFWYFEKCCYFGLLYFKLIDLL